MFQLEYNVQLLHARTSEITGDRLSSWFIWDARLSLCCRNNGIAELFLKKHSVFPFDIEQSKQSSDGHDLAFVHFDKATLFSSIEEDVRMLVIASDGCANNPTFSALFQTQLLYHFG